jgi:hypothetical protein
MKSQVNTVLSEVESLRKQLAVLQEKVATAEEDRFIASMAVKQRRGGNKSISNKRKTKTNDENITKKLRTVTEEHSVGSTSSELGKL